MQDNKVIYTTPIEECNFREPYKIEQSVLKDGLSKKKIKSRCIGSISFFSLILFVLFATFIWMVAHYGFGARILFFGVVVFIYGIGGIIEVSKMAGWLSACNDVQKGDFQVITGKVDGKQDKPHRYRRDAYYYVTTEDGKHARVIGDTRWDHISEGSNVSIVMTRKQKILIIAKEK